MIESVVAELKECPRGAKLLVAGDLNVNLEEPEEYQREEKIVAALTTAWLEDMSAQLLPWQCPWRQDGRMWIMVWAGGRWGEVPDGLHPRDISSYLLECDHLGPSAWLGPLLGTWMPPWWPPEGMPQVPQEEQVANPLPPNHPEEGGRTLRGPTEGCPESYG